MSGEEFEIKTEYIGIEEAWQKYSDDPKQPNIKKQNEINDETKAGYFAHPPGGLNFVNCEPQEEFMDSQENEEKDPLECKKYECKICNRTFSSPRNLKTHKCGGDVHHDGRNYICVICNKSYSRKATLSGHIKIVHKGEKYQFKNCNRTLPPPTTSQPLIPVRLASGEILKMSKIGLTNLRKLTKEAKCSLEEIESSNNIQEGREAIDMPFTDSLRKAFYKLNKENSKLKLFEHHDDVKIGKSTKPIKIRAALDKSTIAWASTTKNGPKKSLLEQLNKILASAPEKPNEVLDKNKAKIPKETLKTPLVNTIRKSKRLNKEQPKNTKPTKRSLLKQFNKINVANEATIPIGTRKTPVVTPIRKSQRKIVIKLRK